jgi:hypothetical protein
LTTYSVIIDIDQDIPEDVLVEHIGAALKRFRQPVKSAPTPPRVTVRKMATGGYVKPDENHKYTLATDTTVPQPVAVELGAAALTYLKELAKRTGPFEATRTPRQHPFEGPEVFDDDVTVDSITSTKQDLTGEMYPTIAELLKDKSTKELHRPADSVEPLAEGDWELKGGDEVGTD